MLKQTITRQWDETFDAGAQQCTHPHQIHQKFTTVTVLSESKQAATKVKANTKKDVPLPPATFTTCADRKAEVNSHNYAIQATFGTKQGAAEAISNIVGTEVTDQVLCNTDGSIKGVNKFILSEVIQAVHYDTKRLTKCDIISLLIATIQFLPDFHKKIVINLEQLHAKISGVYSYGIAYDESTITLTILTNMHCAAQHDCGCNFCEPL